MIQFFFGFFWFLVKKIRNESWAPVPEFLGGPGVVGVFWWVGNLFWGNVAPQKRKRVFVSDHPPFRGFGFFFWIPFPKSKTRKKQDKSNLILKKFSKEKLGSKQARGPQPNRRQASKGGNFNQKNPRNQGLQKKGVGGPGVPGSSPPGGPPWAPQGDPK